MISIDPDAVSKFQKNGSAHTLFWKKRANIFSMTTETFSIRFDFLVESARLALKLEADVQEHHSETYYVISNFRIAESNLKTVLPPISVQKRKDIWVHTDSGQSTDLSAAAGAAIDD